MHKIKILWELASLSPSPNEVKQKTHPLGVWNFLFSSVSLYARATATLENKKTKLIQLGLLPLVLGAGISFAESLSGKLTKEDPAAMRLYFFVFFYLFRLSQHCSTVFSL